MEPVQEQAARKASSSSFSFSYFSIDFTDVHKEATQSGKEYIFRVFRRHCTY